MLKTMRASFHQLKWTLFAVIIVFVLGFVFFSGSNWGGNASSQVVAKVGGDQVSAVEFDRVYQNQVQKYRELYKGSFSPDLARALDLPRQVLDGMIERKLRLEAARRLGAESQSHGRQQLGLGPVRGQGSSRGRLPRALPQARPLFRHPQGLGLRQVPRERAQAVGRAGGPRRRDQDRGLQ